MPRVGLPFSAESLKAQPTEILGKKKKVAEKVLFFTCGYEQQLQIAISRGLHQYFPYF
jgi:hypothetical protein